MSNKTQEYNEQEVFVRNGINVAVAKYHTESAARGWWIHAHHDDPEVLMHVCAGKIALIHSEVSEALEGMRKNKMDEHLPHRRSIEVELADALIRIFDLAGKLGLDLGGATVEKGRYNSVRADHNLANRGRADGKKF